MKIAVRHLLSRLTILVASVIALAGPSGAHAAANFYGRLNVAINYLDQEQGFVGYALSNNRAGRPWRGNPFITTPRGPANRLGLNRITVTNTMDQFRDRGLIDIENRKIIIKDIDTLRKMTNILV